MESSLFNAGIRPAINVGISVSRVGGSAQVKSMKSVAGTLRVDQAQYRELEAFSKFGSDLDAATMAVLEKGKRNVEILKQGQYVPIPVKHQVAIIYLGTKGLLQKVPINKISEFEKEYIDFLELKHADVLTQIGKGVFDDSIKSVLETVSNELVQKYS